MPDIPTVAVIMSTYNGEKYLREQIDSILAQEGVNVELYIRDDGSSDRTRDIIAGYTERFGNVHAEYGKNVGIGRSFMNMLTSADDWEYYAFSDQDDYWEHDKLSQAVRLVRNKEESIGNNSPILYYSNVNVTDEKLNIIRKSSLEKRVHSIASAVMRRAIPGCTMMMNARARQLIILHPITDDMLGHYHDSLIVSMVYAFGGEVICDPEAYMRYRQHGDNSEGSPIGIIGRLKKEWRYIRKNGGKEPKIAQSILDGWATDVDPKQRATLEIIAGYRRNPISRLKIVFSPAFRTGDWRLTLLGKAKALLGLI